MVELPSKLSFYHLLVCAALLNADFCKKISEKTRRRLAGENESDSEEEVQQLRMSDDEDAPFIHHPFRVSEKAEIVMNIRVRLIKLNGIHEKSGVIVQKCSLVAELKLKMAVIAYLNFQFQLHHLRAPL